MAKEIPLTKGKVAIVDDKDFEWLSQWKWCYAKGYAVRTFRNKETKKVQTVHMHRAILNVTDSRVYIDHADGNPLNNTRANLRICTPQQNQMNRRNTKRKTSTSKYKGVYFNKRERKWHAQIVKDKKRIHLGYFTDEKEAARAYNAAASLIFGEFACLNQIEGEC